MSGIRGHSLWEVASVFALFFVIAFAALRKQPNGTAIALSSVALVAVLYGIARLWSAAAVRLRRANLIMLRDLAAAEPSDARTREATQLADRILKGDPVVYRSELDGMTSFVSAAQGTSDVAQQCRRVLFKHMPWSQEMERTMAALRYQLREDEYGPWLEWFLNAQVSWPEYKDRVADTALYALPRIAEPERTRLLIRCITHATKSEAWRHFARVQQPALATIDPSQLTSFQSEKLELLRVD